MREKVVMEAEEAPESEREKSPSLERVGLFACSAGKTKSMRRVRNMLPPRKCSDKHTVMTEITA
jgi:hypothetical protein